MPGAIILANQPTGAGNGSAGIARNDLWFGQVVNLSCTTSGNSSFAWTMLNQPPTSAATLSTPTAATSSFTPDVVGTYRIRLVTNGGGVGNEQTLVYRVRYNSVGNLANRGWAYPALGEIDIEANYGGNQRGWGEDLEGILEDVRTGLVSGSYGINSASNVVSLKVAPVTLTDAATIAIDAAVGPNYKVTLGGNRTLGNPTNAVEGREIRLLVTQDVVGNRTLAFDTDWIAVDPSTTIDSVASNSSIVTARAFDLGSGVKWYYEVSQINETAAPLQGYGITVSGAQVSVKTSPVALTDAVTIAIDASAGPDYHVTLGGNRTLGNPTSGLSGMKLYIAVQQDGTGGRTLAFDTDWIAVDPYTTVDPTIGAVSTVIAIGSSVSGSLKWYYHVDSSAEAIALTQGYGISVTGATTVALKTADFTLTDAATVSIDADNGPNMSLTATGGVGATRALGNPTNSAVGKRLRIRFVQDATGGRALTFSGNWVNAGFTPTVAQLPNAVSFIEAEARGGTPFWYYTIYSLEMANLTFVTVSGSKTLDIFDANTVQRTTSASSINITVPAENTVNFPIGTVIEIMQDAAGQVTVVPFDGSVTIKSRNSELKTAGDGASIFLKKKGSNSWQLTGDKST